MSEFHFSPRANRASEIHWRPWDQSAFESAKVEGKPVLLAISAVWCHWCHVMDETTYSDSGVIHAINERFVPVRVDNDQRPDVNARYNMGGWPSTALLSPEGEILFGGTYLPPDSMRQVLRQIDGFYSLPENRLALAKRIQEMRTLRGARSRTPQGGALDDATARTVLNLIAADFDEQYGGFSGEQKFPHVPVLQFLLDACARTPDPNSQKMVQKTIHAMAAGGMYDHVFGGFFRYSTTPDFSVPHFEKMLEDLAGLLWVCARAGAMFHDEQLTAVALDVKRYLDDHLWNARWQGYGGSQDADERYYSLDAAGRAQLAEPFIDPIVYTSWNAHAALALLASAPLLSGTSVDTAAWQERGLEILEALWSHSRVDGMLCRYFDGAAHVRGLLLDQVWMCRAMLAAFSATGLSRWLARVGELVQALESLYDADAESYLDRIASDGDPGRVAVPTAPFEENCLMARVLCAFAAFSGEATHAARAQAILRRYSEQYESYGLFAAAYAAAVLDVVAPPVDVHIVGDSSAAKASEMRSAALRISTPAVRVDPIDPSSDQNRLTLLGYPAEAGVAYLCQGKSCFAKATSVDELEKYLAEWLSHRSAGIAS